LNPAIKLSIVVGVQYAQDNVPQIVRALRPALHPEVEVLFCHTAADPDVPALVGTEGHIRIIASAPGSLIPHLWRDGILAAHGERVATTTAHCIPAGDWVEALMAANLENAAIGGTIENDPNADTKARAIFLLRYSAFAPPQAKREVQDLAADNALYRRSDLLRHQDLLEHGFWEPSFHSRFLEAGIRLDLDPALQVIHHNRYSWRRFCAQRLAHGREFGLARARARRLLGRLLLIFLAPGIFPLLLTRIVLATRKNPQLREQLRAGWFWLSVFTLAWVAGETSGYLASLPYRQSPISDL
jgi:hypothetical protein